MSSASPFHSPDVRLLFATRLARLFAFGFLSLILVLYLKEVHLSLARIGLLITLTMAGDVVVSLWITTSADRIGRKRMLIVGAVLMALAGAVFLSTDDFLLLLTAAAIGVISPSSNEIGPFLAVEQAALAQLVTAEQRTRVFAWYNLAGSLATAFGSLLCGLLGQTLLVYGFSRLESYRVVLWVYVGVGVLLAVLFTRLSPAAEAPAAVAPADGLAPPRVFLGLHRSRGVVFLLSALFALDAFAGGFVMQSFLAEWFNARFGADPATLGGLFWAANFLAGFSALAAAAVARRVGLLRTMVFTHVPSNVLLVLVPFMPNLPLAAAVLLLRFSISQMDVPARQSYTAAAVDPDERSAAAGVTGVARTAGASLSPVLAGLLLGNPALAGAPFVVAGGLKLLYDGLLYCLFRTTVPPEELPPPPANDPLAEKRPGA